MTARILFGTLLCFLLTTNGLVNSCGENHEVVREKISPKHKLVKRQTGELGSERKACGSDDSPVPQKRVDSSENLAALRRELKRLNLDAFVIPSGDSHQSEYVAPADHRGFWVSGFSGEGFAVVTEDKAAMWTDGRYFLQADDQLDCNWLFMKGTEGGDSKWIYWLGSNLPSGSKVGADATLTGAFTWLEWEEEIEKLDLKIEPLTENPIDNIWTNRPNRNQEPLEIQELEFAGKSWQDKISQLRNQLEQSGDDAIVLTALDEIAWLFNLRGRAIPYSPVFRAYSIVSKDSIIIYLPTKKQTSNVKAHLNAEGCRDGKDCVRIRDYTQIFDELSTLSSDWNSVILGKVWAYSGGASYAIYNQLDKDKIKLVPSPVMLSKAQKNEVEIQGMLNAHLRDSVALIEMAARLEDGMAAGEDWDEVKVMMELQNRRREQKHFKLSSFNTIAAYGANGAVIHYEADNKTNTKIGTNSMFLLDSGGQYKDGTTDVTRTFHYGTPTNFEKEAYTRVLMGSIDLARVVFPKGTTDTRLDILARSHLLKVGLDYLHGTGHGIGAYLLIHESPVQLRIYKKEEHELEVGYFFSDEPGYYQEGEFGIRLETVLRVIKKDNLQFQHKDDYGELYGFNPVCLMPFETKLIDYSLLNDDQIDWLNRYNMLIKEKVGAELKKQGKDRGLDWMMERTKPIIKGNLPVNFAISTKLSSTKDIFLLFLVLILWLTN